MKGDRYEEIMKKMFMSIEEYEDLVQKCKNLMKITEMSFEDLGKEFKLSKATIERTFNQVSPESFNLSIISRITKIYNFLLNKSEDQIQGNYKGLKSLLEQKKLKFEESVEIGPNFIRGLEKLILRKIDVNVEINIFTDKEKAQKTLNDSKEKDNIDKFIVFFEKLNEIPRVILGALVPDFFKFSNGNKKNRIYQIVYSNSTNKFILLEVIALENEAGDISKEQIIIFNYNEFDYVSDLIGEIRKFMELTTENKKEFNFLIEELKDYLGEKYK